MTGRIYILRAGPFAKIGWAKNDVTGRAKLLQTGCPFPISVAREIPGSRRQEAALHRLFSDMRAHGEWFRWSDAMMTCDVPNGRNHVLKRARATITTDDLFAKFKTAPAIAAALNDCDLKPWPVNPPSIHQWTARGHVPAAWLPAVTQIMVAGQ